MSKSLNQNKSNAISFYKMAYEGKSRKAIELYVGADYIQHNSVLGDGKESFIDYFEKK
jgi:predicted SnoaL-like aldol condensation-catalyzing enzyme